MPKKRLYDGNLIKLLLVVGVIFGPECDKFDTQCKVILICVYHFGLKRMKDFPKCDIFNGFDG